MSRARVTVGGITRWVHVDDDWPGVVAEPVRPRFVGLLDRHPDIDRCGRCGAWRWQRVCRALHYVAVTGQYRNEQDGRRGRRIPGPVDNRRVMLAESDRDATVGDARRPRCVNTEAVSHLSDLSGRGQA